MKNTNKRSLTLRSLFILATLIGAMSISGCNTVHGVGEDTEAVGEAIQGAAK
ncbi:MAG: entericidin A/B family lipoprotein [Opitutales bacterium]|nr:entericidin A/B family lipoprotein [Opitutales bacterium]MCH8541850.1 entericidin A/B family lipoprotein [Opitutales bacterium]